MDRCLHRDDPVPCLEVQAISLTFVLSLSLHGDRYLKSKVSVCEEYRKMVRRQQYTYDHSLGH